MEIVIVRTLAEASLCNVGSLRLSSILLNNYQKKKKKKLEWADLLINFLLRRKNLIEIFNLLTREFSMENNSRLLSSEKFI